MTSRRRRYKRIKIDGDLVCAKCYDDPGCDGCNVCQRKQHHFIDDPYCDECGKPHDGYFGRLKQILGVS